MYDDNSSNSIWPKTLLIRNHVGGMVWQVYHVNNHEEATRLATNASRNAFESRSVVDHKPEMEETWPDWRKTQSQSNSSS